MSYWDSTNPLNRMIWHLMCLECKNYRERERKMAQEGTYLEERDPGYEEQPYSVDDRGNVVDFYSKNGLTNYEQIARLDREAEVDGEFDQLAWDNWGGGEELETWMKTHGFRRALAEAHRL